MEKTLNSNTEHKTSMLLTKDENDQIFQLLGPKCYAMATTVIQMYSTDGPDGVHWIKRDVGVLCLVRDTNRRSYFFRLFCLLQNKVIWEHEVYNGIKYLAPRSFLHTFEAEDTIVAFNFANESEAAHLREILLAKLEMKEITRKARQKSKNALLHSQNSTSRPAPRPAPMPNMNTMSNGFQSSISASFKSSNYGKKFKKKSITKADIGTPQNFQHISHVGWDPNTGFELGNVDESIRQFFDKAGISENDLKDKKTREFIYDFIERHGGLDAVKRDIDQPIAPPPPSPPPPPPVPARNVPPTPQASLRSAPPPPPNVHRTQHPAPPPPPSVPPPSNVLIHRAHDHAKKPTAPIPTAIMNSARAPPPSPPMPPPPMPTDTPLPPPLPPSNGVSNAVPDTRNALMEAIRGGKTLKHVEVETAKLSIDSPRSDLLSEIRKGVELRAVQPVTKSARNTSPENGLAGLLHRALRERADAIHSDSSDGSETSDTEDEWDD